MWKNNPKKSYKGTEPSPKGLGDGVELRRDAISMHSSFLIVYAST